MSGTSLDGLDMALCEFDYVFGKYSYKIITAKTIEYSALWKKSLAEAKDLSAIEYFALHSSYGTYLGEEVNSFLKKVGSIPNAIASHGHTIFHQPNLGFSTQLGCGANLSATTKITTVCDFRSLDVANGGQGAPLVPLGDKLLFEDYQACLNIGGIANISFDDENGNRIAYDICEANMLLNYLAEKTGQPYDKGGEIARSGKINQELLMRLNGLSYYSQKGAKSLGREWFEKNILDLINAESNPANSLATSTEHIATIIGNQLNQLNLKNALLTGGGVFNTFLIEKMRLKTGCEIVIPNAEIVNFKEALIFAFLGYLRLNESVNTLSSVTGASHDSSGGGVYIA